MPYDDPSDDELRLLSALVDVSEQAFGVSAACLEHNFTSAGEHAVRILAKYGLIVADFPGGTWTTKSEALARLAEDLSNGDQIRNELRHLPAGELRTFPHRVRGLRPDIVLDGLKMWILGRALETRMPGRTPMPGPDRLDVEARLSLGQGQAMIRGELLTTGELRAFRDQLATVQDGSTQRAHLVAFKESLEITLIVGAGRTLTGEITIRDKRFHHSATAEVQSDVDLDRTIRGIDAVLAEFS
jgi:hypothetical protein